MDGQTEICVADNQTSFLVNFHFFLFDLSIVARQPADDRSACQKINELNTAI